MSVGVPVTSCAYITFQIKKTIFVTQVTPSSVEAALSQLDHVSLPEINLNHGVPSPVGPSPLPIPETWFSLMTVTSEALTVPVL